MIDPAYLRENLDAVRTALASRGMDLTRELEELAALEARRRRLLPEVEGLKREQNAAGDEVARAKRQGLDTAKIQEASRQRAQEIKQKGVELDLIEQRRNHGLLVIPNLPHASVPAGTSAADNKECGASAPRAPSRRRRSRTGISGRRSASSTSSAGRRSRARASPCSSARARGWRAR